VKAVILAGGEGSRLSEETETKPKPMIEIGGKPVLWHIMKLYSAHGINDFIICLGYKGFVIKEYFSNYLLHVSDITFDLAQNKMEIHQYSAEPWKVTLVDTGAKTMTGGRLKQISPHLDENEFCMTYGDGLSDVNINKLIQFHKSEGKLATVTAVLPPGRFGNLKLDEQRVTGFEEKPKGDEGWINGGFFVLSPKVLDYIDDDTTIWERTPMEQLASSDNLAAYKHHGFWQPMDTLREKRLLENLWNSGKAPWKTWE
jgi:glucose-1-phosphate cytidylyltransferase